MPAVTYPTTLPAPSQWQGVPRERRAASSSPGNTQLRNRSRDAVQDIDAQWLYTSAEMTIWRAWYEDTLLDGMLWFAATVPGAGGWAQRVAKFRTKSLKDEYIGNGVHRVSAQVQQRGISAAPVTYVNPVVSSSQGTGYTPTAPSAQAGDGLLLVILHDGTGSVPAFASGWGVNILNTNSSGSDMRISVFGRTATGDANDALTTFTIGGGGTGLPLWGMLQLRGVDDAHFPSAMASLTDYKTGLEGGGGYLNPNGLTKPGGTRQVFVAIASNLSASAGAAITAAPTGYTQFGQTSSASYDDLGTGYYTTQTAHLGAAYKVVAGATDNPDAFTAATSGSAAVVTVAITIAAA